MTRKPILATVALALLALAAPALATDGYFSLGYGTPYKGMAGAGQALHLSTLASATNPATIAFVKGYDIGVGLFAPNREYSVSGNPSGYPGTFGLAPGTYESHSTGFVMPSMAGAWHLSGQFHVGLAIYGNGGMNTNYPNKVFGQSPTGINLMQAFVAPSFTWEFADHQAIGISPIFGWQSFEAKGLGAFAMFSSAPTKLTNNGKDTSTGFGARIGYHGKFGEYFGVGASYQTKIAMGEFEDYAGLFAEHGDFDIPENWTVGISVFPSKCVSIAVDVQQIYYSNVASVGNPLLPNLMQAPLGADGGAGFGWKDVTVFKIGAQWEVNPTWTLRAGYAHNNQPIPESEVLFNILAPGVIQDHATVGVSTLLSPKTKFHFSLMRAFSKSVEGANPLEAPGQQTIKLTMDQWEGEIGFSFGF
ncbi:MAG TPA: outer membrane protein transport protein [Thermoanaerobaculia bacterium]|nr:outer membrane protein transport protein [Thermoanaerobaculia bacterium]